MTTRRILLAALAQLWLLLAPATSVADPLLSIQPTTVHANVGDAVALSIAVSGAVDLYSFQFDLAFDPAVVATTAVTEGAFLMSAGPTFFVSGVIDNTLGLISFTAASLIGPIAGANGDGVLVELLFDALALGGSSVVLQNVILLDSLLADIPFDTRDGTIVIGVTAVPEPAAWTLMLLAAALGVLAMHGPALGRARRSGLAAEGCSGGARRNGAIR